ncbi:MAG: hypothetical protein ACREEY_00190 [Brevundimonas sp.]
MQTAVRDLLALTPTLHDTVDFSVIELATPILDRLAVPLSAADIEALLSILPANGDTAFGLNWTILHAIESSPLWPRWDLLEESLDNEWRELLLARLKNGGYAPPA